MIDDPTCPKCSSKMEKGFILDRTYFPSSHRAESSLRVEGAPERSFWTGVKIKGRKQCFIDTYRCSRCGLLESYASRQNFDAAQL